MEEIYKLALTDNPVDLVVDKNLKVSSNVNSIAEEPYCMYKIMPASYGEDVYLLPNGKKEYTEIDASKTKPLHGEDVIVTRELIIRKGGTTNNNSTLFAIIFNPMGVGSDSLLYNYSLEIKIGDYDKWASVGSQEPNTIFTMNSVLPSDYYDYIYNKINESIIVQFKLRFN